MKHLRMLHPICWALSPTLFLYAHNHGELSLAALAAPLAISLAFTLLCWGLFTLWVRDPLRAGLMTTWLIVLTFSYGHIYNVTEHFERGVPGWHYVFLALWVLVLLVGLRALRRPQAAHTLLNTWANATALLLLCSLCLSITYSEFTRWRTEMTVSPLRKARSGVEHIDPATLPNIYYIILDSYARDDTFQRIYGYDNTPFLRALEKRGFYVARQSHANYCQTILSLSSSLNMTYLDALAVTPGPASNDRYPLNAMLQNSRVQQTVKHYGYTMIAFPSAYAPMNLPSDINVQQVQGLSDFYTTFMQTTPLLELSLGRHAAQFDPYAVHRQRTLWLFDHAPTVAGLPGPLFVFVHILAPHQPLVFDANGGPVKGDPFLAVSGGRHWRNERDYRADYNRRYRDEVIYLNKRTLQMIDAIRANARRPTAIIIQGDHGPGFLPDTEDELKTMSIPERFAIFNAYYFPNGNPSALYPAISPVNSFRVLFNTYLHTNYPPKEDRSYFSPFLHPYHFQDVTAQTPYPKHRAAGEDTPSAVGSD